MSKQNFYLLMALAEWVAFCLAIVKDQPIWAFVDVILVMAWLAMAYREDY